MDKQYALSVLVRVKEGRLNMLTQKLDEIQKTVIRNRHHIFSDLDRIHYARWFLVPPSEDLRENFGHQLAWFINMDVPPAELLHHLATHFKGLLDEVYENCEGFSQQVKPDETDGYENRFVRFMDAHSFKENAFYMGAPGKSVLNIRREEKLRNFLREHLDHLSKEEKTSAQSIHKELQAVALQHPEFSWLREGGANMPRIRWVTLILFVLLLLALLPLIIIWVIIIQFFFERKDKPLGINRSGLNLEKMKKLEVYEDISYQNQFSQVVEMKKGWMRRMSFLGLMIFARVLIKLLFVKGKLMGIPTIHFARWVMVNDKKRVLFASNFDGSWQQYLGDFIDKSGWGLTGIFSNTTLFPRSKFLFFKGAYDEEKFLAWSRYTEVVTQVWYAAYPEMSIKNVNNNGYIRYELLKSPGRRTSKKLLNRL